jgi:GMP synthase PP-ATPase subunit
MGITVLTVIYCTPAVTSNDAMTADWARLTYDLLASISNRIEYEVALVKGCL